MMLQMRGTNNNNNKKKQEETWNRQKRFMTLLLQTKNVLTIFSRLRNTPNLPNRTWNGEHTKLPSASSTTITSIAPVNVAPFISL